MSIKKWLKQMSTKDKKPLHSEVTFLPPLEMVLAFFDKKKNKRTQSEEATDETVAREKADGGDDAK